MSIVRLVGMTILDSLTGSIHALRAKGDRKSLCKEEYDWNWGSIILLEGCGRRENATRTAKIRSPMWKRILTKCLGMARLSIQKHGVKRLSDTDKQRAETSIEVWFYPVKDKVHLNYLILRAWVEYIDCKRSNTEYGEHRVKLDVVPGIKDLTV